MISETITIPKTISDQEDRFVVKLKDNLLRMIKEINKNGKKIDEIKIEHDDPDYTDIFNSKANVDASNIGYGDQFIEKKDDEGEVVYSADDNREDWGLALTNSKNTIAEDNVTLVSSQNVYDETHPYMDKDGEGNWINDYHYINYKNLTEHEGAEDINKQDRWSEQDFFQPHEPNDNTVKENLVALDTAIWEVAEALEALDKRKANINLDNLTKKDPRSSAQDNTLYGQTVLMNSTHIVSDHENIFVNYEDIYNSNINQWVRVYHIDTDFDPSGGSDPLKANVSANNVGACISTGSPHREELLTTIERNNQKNWGKAIGVQTGADAVSNVSVIDHGYMVDDQVWLVPGLTELGHNQQSDMLSALSDQRVASVYLMAWELRGAMWLEDGVYKYNITGNEDYETTCSGEDTCFIDEDFSTGNNIISLNYGLLDTIRGLSNLYKQVNGVQGGTSYYTELDENDTPILTEETVSVSAENVTVDILDGNNEVVGTNTIGKEFVVSQGEDDQHNPNVIYQYSEMIDNIDTIGLENKAKIIKGMLDAGLYEYPWIQTLAKKHEIDIEGQHGDGTDGMKHDITELFNTIGDYSTNGTILYTIGDASYPDSSSILGRLNTIEAEIGDTTTPASNSILGRLAEIERILRNNNLS